jgi:hypothetical protein
MEIVVETYRSIGEGAHSEIRVRPLAGQGVPTSVKVECSKKVREQYPIGQIFLIPLAWKHPDGLESCLYVSYRKPELMQPISRQDARSFVLRQFGGRL